MRRKRRRSCRRSEGDPCQTSISVGHRQTPRRLSGGPRGHRLALRAVGVVVVLEQARAENLAIPPEAEAVRVHGAKLAVDAILPLHARPEYGQRALAALLDLPPLGAQGIEEEAEPALVDVAERDGARFGSLMLAHGHEKADVGMGVLAAARLFARGHDLRDGILGHRSRESPPQRTGSGTRRTPKRAWTAARISPAKAAISAARAPSRQTMARL